MKFPHRNGHFRLLQALLLQLAMPEYDADKISLLLHNLPSKIKCNYQPHEGLILGMPVCKYCFRITIPCKETIFPGEVIQMGRFKIDVPIECISGLNKAYIKITLRMVAKMIY